VCCSVLQRVAACCSVLQRVAACCSVLHLLPTHSPRFAGHFLTPHPSILRSQPQYWSQKPHVPHSAAPVRGSNVSKKTYIYEKRPTQETNKCRGLSPLTEEIRLEIFGCVDLPDFRVDLLSDGDSVYSRANSFEILWTPVKTCMICMGPAVKSCWKNWQS